MSESITWYAVTDHLPDDEMTVLVFRPETSEPVWVGFRAGDQWRSVDGFPFESVTHWADLPEGPNTCE